MVVTDALEVCPPCRDGEHAGDELTVGVCDCCGLSLEVCRECGYPLIIDPDMGIREMSGLCGDCDMAMGQACPDCKAEPYEPCHIDCSSRWT